ncbi:MAG: 16S rRNA (cytosine(1402)-N(4))-methyltransferase RsmH [Alphaproteobacteria bacterium]|nr:16S rRNA (cytosine(1402)-N(4))-methyltransferase RsmH [Alphaproteobacteria bacterium]MCL2505544.1 16S rRNA (cytosine(1402)-N(4))-methyltransferase RsmH [Alphaproteobacteria bacterium]
MNNRAASEHFPVMLSEVLSALNLEEGSPALVVDATFGRGGYSRAILESFSADVVAIDRDPEAVAAAHKLETEFPSRFRILCGNFSSLVELLQNIGISKIDAIVLDLGVSSPQINNPMRGFSFSSDGPLDMRMSGQGMSAKDAVNSLSEEELSDIIWKFGQERFSRRIARAIVGARALKEIVTTAQLAAIIRKVVPRSKDGIDPATRSFQAVRIFVNNELDELNAVLEGAKTVLKDNGRLVVVSFHSLEDSIVKDFMRSHSGVGKGVSRYLPEPSDSKDVCFKIVTKKPLVPSEDEIRQNPRSGSAKLRIAQKIIKKN